MDNILILQLIIGICFIGIVVTLFLETKDYLTYSLIFIFIVGVSTYFLNPSSLDEKEAILAIDWEVIVFLFCLFCIVEILNEKKVFHQIALKIVNKFQGKPRKMFYVLSIVSTLIATIVEDLSVALIFIPIIIKACRKLNLNPTPYMYGITICINLASTLTPFGSAENIIIANRFNLDLYWHLVYLGIYFVITLAITLFLIDRLVLTKYMKRKIRETMDVEKIRPEIKNEESEKALIEKEKPITMKLVKRAPLRIIKEKYIYDLDHNSENLIQIEENEENEEKKKIMKIKIDKKVYRKNLIGLGLFLIILAAIPNIIVAGILGLILFIFLNPIKIKSGKNEPSLSTYLQKIDAKLIYFFIILFLMVYFMEISGLTKIIDILFESISHHSTFLISVMILLTTSLLSGLLDDAPVTILFLPIIADIIATKQYISNPIFIAFTLGINLGGNFLPQGAACDMMTLEFARKYKVRDFTYKNFAMVGSFFALLHILLGIGYIYLYLLIF